MTDFNAADLQDAVDVILSPFPYSESASDEEYFEMRDKALGYVRAMAEEMDLIPHNKLDRDSIDRILEIHIKKVEEWISVGDETHKELIHEMCRFFGFPELDFHGNPTT